MKRILVSLLVVLLAFPGVAFGFDYVQAEFYPINPIQEINQGEWYNDDGTVFYRVYLDFPERHPHGLEEIYVRTDSYFKLDVAVPEYAYNNVANAVYAVNVEPLQQALVSPNGVPTYKLYKITTESISDDYGRLHLFFSSVYAPDPWPLMCEVLSYYQGPLWGRTEYFARVNPITVDYGSSDDSDDDDDSDYVVTNQDESKVLDPLPSLTVAAPSPETTPIIESTFFVDSTSFVVNGQTFSMDVAPEIIGERTFMPVRFLANAIGIPDENIVWDQPSQTATFRKGDSVVVFQIGSRFAVINGKFVEMDVEPYIKNGRTMLPARWLAESLGAKVEWIDKTKEMKLIVEGPEN